MSSKLLLYVPQDDNDVCRYDVKHCEEQLDCHRHPAYGRSQRAKDLESDALAEDDAAEEKVDEAVVGDETVDLGKNLLTLTLVDSELAIHVALCSLN